ncbi:hypothetical protein EMPG_16868 [Blastomyces silverae]|uniref:Uncharacterized protein n=1 Tax=Blastomyces silverae TaxID=2060906 RepID=A0A0H1B885_9EURO|nr:hypothetical protein EMPG_16868 [Blastomyces silverae]
MIGRSSPLSNLGETSHSKSDSSSTCRSTGISGVRGKCCPTRKCSRSFERNTPTWRKSPTTRMIQARHIACLASKVA